MDGKMHEMRKKRYTVIYHKRMEKIEKKIGGLQSAIKRLEKQEESERRQLGIYAQKIMDLDAPPEPTKLD
jgi:prefoldin subunit 5